jgi:hypothetical protein
MPRAWWRGVAAGGALVTHPLHPGFQPAVSLFRTGEDYECATS